jgi:hypothetical protein
MTAVLRSLENPRLILLVSSVGRIAVEVNASFERIVRSSPAGVSSLRVHGVIEGPAV